MVDPADVERILSDAARLAGEGEIVVFGSAALARWLDDPPATRDVDLWCDPPEKGDVLTALMGELSWYHERHGVFVEVWAPETFAAPEGWRERARVEVLPDRPGVRLVVPHPHDVLMSKLERLEEKDVDHLRRILAELPLAEEELEALAETCPHRRGRIDGPDRVRRFEAGLARARRLVGGARRRSDPRGRAGGSR